MQKSNLPLCGKDETWILKHLKRLGFERMQDVLLCYLDTDGRITAHAYGQKPPASAQAMAQDEVMW